jgi:hypothetical protein
MRDFLLSPPAALMLIAKVAFASFYDNEKENQQKVGKVSVWSVQNTQFIHYFSFVSVVK